MDDPQQMLRLLQLTDSGFPTGAFAFSHGLEGLLATGLVTSERDVTTVITAHLSEGFADIECPAMALAWRAAAAQDLATMIELDRVIDALKPVPAYRNSSVRTGRRLLESSVGVVSGTMLDSVREQTRAGMLAGHHPLAFGVVTEAAGIAEETAALALGAGLVNALAAAAVRLGIIGAGAAQRLMAACHGDIEALAVSGRATAMADMGAFMPMIDIAGLRQPALAGRVFAS